MNLKNTKLLDQINWETEIASQKPCKTKDNQAKRLTNAALVWSFVQNTFSPNISTSTEDFAQANLVRIHQYFYAKFVYNHSLYYDEKYIDFKELEKEYLEKHILKVLRTKFGKLPKSKLPFRELKKLDLIFTAHIQKKLDKDKNEDGGYEEVKRLVEKEGLKCIKPKGLGKEGDRDTVCTIYDSVRYHISLMKGKENRTKKIAKSEVDDHKKMIDRYHPLVKKIYEEIKQFPNIGDVWAMEGGGMQSQVFFGNKTGYLAILYLDMKNSKAKLRKNYTLQVNWHKNDILFKNFKVDGIKVKTSFETYGKN